MFVKLLWIVSLRQETKIARHVAASELVPAGLYEHEVVAVVFQVRDGALHVLLWRRAFGPFANDWALPGGGLASNERLGTSISRHLAAKVDLTEIGFLEQLETRSDVDRDPRGRVIATAYVALVSTDVDPRVPSDTAWYRVDELPSTAFDHDSIVLSGRDRLRAKLTYTNIAFALVPEMFTIAELRKVYESSLGHNVSPTNLQRVLLRRTIIEPTSSVVQPSSSGGRPATIYRFQQRTLRVTDPFAAFRPPAPAL